MEHAVSKGAVWVEAKIPLPAPSLDEMCEIIWSKVTPKTRILFISHIASPTALRLPVEELCRRAKKAGIITFIDGAHIPGQIDLDLSTLQADIYVGNCHKWMCTPKGSAFLWASDEYKD
jgi:isopenicillin-N epimerase